jgi:hypothetical protein
MGVFWQSGATKEAGMAVAQWFPGRGLFEQRSRTLLLGSLWGLAGPDRRVALAMPIIGSQLDLHRVDI